MRRLPVYLILDCSESMIGEGVNSVQAGVDLMFRALRSDPHALETVWVSCITFDSQARLLFPLTELTEVLTPKLKVKPGTALGAALNFCADRIQQEVRRSTPMQKGDWRPLVILLTDGQPTDDWRPALKRLGSGVKPRPANIYAIGCGQEVDPAGLRELTDIVLHLPDMTEEKVRRLFVWLTASVTEGSRGVYETPGQVVNYDKLPDDVVKVDATYPHQLSDKPRQVFLFGHCSRSRKPYLMRFKLGDGGEIYEPVSAHAMEKEEPGMKRQDFKLPTISSELLNGTPPCPHCQNPLASSCGNCGTIFCSHPNNHEDVICPGCGGKLKWRPPSETAESFEVRQSLS